MASTVPESGDDVVVPFTLEQLDCRGRVVRLGEALDAILTRHNYPAPVARLLGEAVVLAALIGSSLKFEGKFILQTQTDGPVNLIVVDLDAPDGLRGYARFDADAVHKAIEAGAAGPGQLLGNGHLAMTVDQGPHTERYQGIVALEGGTLEDVAHAYFHQSEQVPTLVRLAVAQLTRKASGVRTGGPAACSCNICRRTARARCPTCRATAISPIPRPPTAAFVEADKWTEVRALRRTPCRRRACRSRRLARARAVPALSRDRRARVRAGCASRSAAPARPSGSRPCCATISRAEERADMAVNGEIEVVCEFCSADYHFRPHEFDETRH